MERSPTVLNNERGSIMVIGLAVAALITLVGISALTTSNIEVRIASNDHGYKMAFYKAEEGIEVAQELLERNIGRLGFDPDANDENNGKTIKDGHEIDRVYIEPSSLAFWSNDAVELLPTETNRDFYMPPEYSRGEPHTNIAVGINRIIRAPGAAFQMAAGYRGKGKGSANAGTHIIYDIYSRHIGQRNSKATVAIQWRHVVGDER